MKQNVAVLLRDLNILESCTWFYEETVEFFISVYIVKMFFINTEMVYINDM